MNLRIAVTPNLRDAPATRALLVLNFLVWGLGWAGDAFGFAPISALALRDGFGLFPAKVFGEGMLWTPFTYQFLHGNAYHLVVNLMGLFLLGPDLERTFRPAHFLALYLCSGFLGGLAYLGVSHMLFGQIHPCVGASGAIMGLLGAIVAIYPQRIYLLLPLMIPMRAMVLAVLLLSSHIFFMFTPYGGNVAYDVHLFGGLTGFGYAALLSWRHRRRWRAQWQGFDVLQARREFEHLLMLAAEGGEGALLPAEAERLRELQAALRYEDVPTLSELREAISS